ncbi:unannotated protein [freshwater metagenome]|uniref:Unannotated protein n=1 Tax=freshwater metagenome TaxID=449393 RepID=A0A6J7PGT7_9ZZZZ
MPMLTSMSIPALWASSAICRICSTLSAMFIREFFMLYASEATMSAETLVQPASMALCAPRRLGTSAR